MAERVPELAERVTQELERGDSPIACVAQASAADATVTRPEFPQKPTWRELAEGARPPAPDPDYEEEPGQWPHGWQFYASLGFITHHRETVVLPALDVKAQARLRSQSGAHAGDHITALPTCEYTVATPERMNGLAAPTRTLTHRYRPQPLLGPAVPADERGAARRPRRPRGGVLSDGRAQAPRLGLRARVAAFVEGVDRPSERAPAGASAGSIAP